MGMERYALRAASFDRPRWLGVFFYREGLGRLRKLVVARCGLSKRLCGRWRPGFLCERRLLGPEQIRSAALDRVVQHLYADLVHREQVASDFFFVGLAGFGERRFLKSLYFGGTERVAGSKGMRDASIELPLRASPGFYVFRVARITTVRCAYRQPSE